MQTSKLNLLLVATFCFLILPSCQTVTFSSELMDNEQVVLHANFDNLRIGIRSDVEVVHKDDQLFGFIKSVKKIDTPQISFDRFAIMKTKVNYILYDADMDEAKCDVSIKPFNNKEWGIAECMPSTELWCAKCHELNSKTGFCEHCYVEGQPIDLSLLHEEDDNGCTFDNMNQVIKNFDLDGFRVLNLTSDDMVLRERTVYYTLRLIANKNASELLNLTKNECNDGVTLTFERVQTPDFDIRRALMLV